jgi:hypothetical protein
VRRAQNRNLIELRDQLTNAINQLQGTKNMVQRARTGGRMQNAAGAPVVGADGRPAKGHSSRKNKPQRCSVCGGIGHKSRTCSMAVAPNAQAMCPPQQVQWAATQPGADPNQPQMYMVQNAAGGWQPAAPGQVQMVGGVPMGMQMQPMAMAPGQVRTRGATRPHMCHDAWPSRGHACACARRRASI